MDKKNYRKELTIGVIVSFAIILFTSVHFFVSLNKNLESEDQMITLAEEKFDLLDKLKNQILEINDVKLDYIATQNIELFTPYRRDIHEVNDILKGISKRNKYYDLPADKIKILGEHLNKFYNFDLDIYSNKTKQVAASTIHQERASLLNEVAIISQDLIKQRSDVIQDSKDDLERLKYITYLLIAIGLAGLIFILLKMSSLFVVLRAIVKNQKESNDQLQGLQVKTNNDNWVLQAINEVDEQLRGDYSDKKIAERSLQAVIKTVKALAGTFYSYNEDYRGYLLAHRIGIAESENVISSFHAGEGILGECVKNKELILVDNLQHEHLHLETSIAANIPTHIYIVPILYEDESIGLMEICCSKVDDNLELLRKIFLERVHTNIAMTLKVAQAHSRMSELYEELQQQTEELEAQQEELRTTNEELIHKTHLLEASEEELRVQQEELIQTNGELDEKAKLLAAQNDDLEKARGAIAQKIKEVEQSSKYKSEFMANMSHELRTPLNSILILAKLLQDNKKNNLSEEQVKYASVIHSAGSDLLHLINELLDLAKIESGKVELYHESIDTNYLLTYIQDFFKDVASHKNITFKAQVTTDVPKNFSGDEQRIQQVLKNLLSNAFKFTPENGIVKLSIENKENNLVFSVIDSGIGIAPEKQELIFEAFKQEDGSTSRKYGGTGLGLSICKEIATLMRGKIELESVVGQGSTFRFTIPLESADTSHANSNLPIPQGSNVQQKQQQEVDKKPFPLPVAPGESNNSLLIIEDDFIFADILKDYAIQDGYEVHISHDGEDGVKKARNLIPAAIILDIMLPKMDGWEVLKNLKKDPLTKDIPVHMMSAGTFLHDEPLAAGAISFMSKPVSEESLVETFSKIKASTNNPLKKILLIEDQEIQSDFIKQALEEQNTLINQAFNAEQALAFLEQQKTYDCIILDLNLPDKSGMDLLNEIKANPAFKELPIIINTAMELTSEQTTQILRHSQAMVLKSAKSNNRLIDEVNLFLNKIANTKNNNFSFPNQLPSIDSVSNLAGKTILLADDDMRNIFALSNAFESFDMKIEIANNGQEALDILEKNETVDLVLMDIMMPVMDGYEAIQKIREHKKYASLPIIAVTAKAMKGDKEKTIAVGANDYISKPIDVDKLISLMRVWLS